MQFPGGTRTLMTALEVLAGAAGAQLLANKVLKTKDNPTGEQFGLKPEMLIGGALAAVALFAGTDYGRDLIALAAGALAVPVAQKALEATTPAISGWPYVGAELPQGGATYVLPSGQKANLATSIAGLS